ncbi:MAG: creatininase family protein [Planctomycetes bacterium]|nr:creatininase family protein [Planctomycetota bacterium]
MSILFGEQKSPDLEGFVKDNALILLPVGQTEEHGPHLPINTDSIIAREIASAVCQRMVSEVPALVMDTVCTGYSSAALKNWPGTIVLQPETVIDALCDTCVSLIEMGFRRIAMLSIHGNHQGIMRMVARKVADATDVYPVAVFPIALGMERFLEVAQAGPEGSCHAGELETSLMLHLAPGLVDMEKVTEPNPLRPASRFSKGVFWSTWGRERSKHGYYGDPTVASAETGKVAFDAIVEETAAFLAEFCKETS